MSTTVLTAPRNEGPVVSPAFKVAPTRPADWVMDEFAQAALPDRRHHRRLQVMITAFAQKPTAPVPQACGSLAEVKAAYRFVENEAIIPAMIREPHHQATLQRVRAHAIILAVQDTTTLNYTTHPCTQGLGPICHTPRTIGLLLHSTLAITPAGQPLGFLHNVVRARDRHARVSSRERRKLTHKESYKWVESLTACQAMAPLCPDTMLVNITDREGDLYDLFVQALGAPAGGKVELLVRARHDRKLAEGSATLWAQVAHQPVAATLQVQVGRRGDQPRRLASLSIRFCAVQLKAPKRKAEQPSLRLWAIQAREVHPPKGTTPILWQLLTTLPVTCAAEAIERVRWYAQRWQIEVIHKVLKSGCKVEQRQMETAQRLERVLSIDLVVAWRILALCKAARELPDDPISDWLPTAQWQALWSYVHQRPTAPKTAPPVRQAVRWIAQLGGFLGRKSDGEPGTLTLWRGLQQLDAMTKMWELCHSAKRRQKCG
jgi:Transposase DNA-binding/Transposase Tn5 dimerisation domain